MEKFYRRGRKTRETFDRNSSLPSERGLKLRLYPFPERISKSPFRFLQCSPKRSRPLEESVAGKEHATTEPIRRCFVPVVTRFYDPFTRAVSLIERNKITSHLLFIITPVALHISRWNCDRLPTCTSLAKCSLDTRDRYSRPPSVFYRC